MKHGFWDLFFLGLCVIDFAAGVVFLAASLSLIAQHAAAPGWLTACSLCALGVAMFACGGVFVRGRRRLP